MAVVMMHQLEQEYQDQEKILLNKDTETITRTEMLQCPVSNTTFGLMWIWCRNNRLYMDSKNISFRTCDNDTSKEECTNMCKEIAKTTDAYIYNKFNLLNLFRQKSITENFSLVIYKVQNINADLLNWQILRNMSTAQIMFVVQDGILKMNNNPNSLLIGNFYKNLMANYKSLHASIDKMSKEELIKLSKEYIISDQIHWYSTKKAIYKVISKYINNKLQNSYWQFYDKIEK